MQVVDWSEGATDAGVTGRGASERVRAFTIGVFDGVHRAHQDLIHRCRTADEGMEPAVFTFAENPAARVSPDSYPGDLATLRQKLELLSAFGVALTVVARFTEDFRALPGAAFLDILVDRLGARRIVVGDNFKCGRDLDMDARTAARHVHDRGARVDIAPPLTDNEALISSTRIRQAVKRGAMATANRLLGRRFELDITDAAVEAAKKSWYIRRLAQVLPPPGNYDVTVEGEETTRTAVITQDHVGIPRQETRCPSRIEFFPAGG